MCLNDTLAHLEVQYKNRIFSINKSKNDHELQLFIKLESFQKEEVRIFKFKKIFIFYIVCLILQLCVCKKWCKNLIITKVKIKYFEPWRYFLKEIMKFSALTTLFPTCVYS